MSPLLQTRRGTLALTAGGIAIAGALFGAGFLPASATGNTRSSDGPPATTDAASQRTVPGRS